MWKWFWNTLEKISLFVVRLFPSTSKEGEVVIGLVTMLALLALIISGVGLIIELVFGISWYMIWVGVIVWWIVIRANDRINR